MLNQSFAYSFAQLLWVDLGSGCPASDELHVLVVTIALLVQLDQDTFTATHESCRLLHQTSFSSLGLNVGSHQEPAHMPLCQCDGWVLHELLNARQRPRSGRPWVFVKKVTSHVDLHLVENTAELYMSLRLLFLDIELVHPTFLHAIDGNIQLLQHAEVGAGWRTYQQHRLLFANKSQRLALVLFDVEVPPIREVHGRSRHEAELLGNFCNSLGRVHLSDVYAQYH